MFLSSIFILISIILPLITRLPTFINKDFPEYISAFKKSILYILESISEKIPLIEPNKINLKINEGITSYSQKVVNLFINSIDEIGLLLLLVPLFTFFFLKDGPNLKRWLIGLVPNSHFEMALHLFHRINEQVSQYIRGRIIETLFLSIIVGIFLIPTGLSHIIVLSLFVGVTNLIPYFGPFIGVIPPLLVAVIIGLSTKVILYIIVVVIIVGQVIDNVILVPFLISRFSNLHPLLVIVSVIIGGNLMGIVGMIISIPAVSIINIFIQEFYAYYKYKSKEV